MKPLIHYLPSALRKRLFLLIALTSRAMTLGVRGVVCDEEGRVLLVRHTYVEGWHLPGGGVERGETLHDAVVKEIAEETGLVLTAPPRLFNLYINPRTSRFDHVAVLIADSWTGEIDRTPDWEIAEKGFFPLNALPEETTAPTRARLEEVFNGRPVSANW